MNPAQFILHLGVGGHRGQLRFPGIVSIAQASPDAMHQPFKQAQLGFCWQLRELAFDFVTDWRCHNIGIISLSAR